MLERAWYDTFIKTQKHIQILSDISLGIYLREASSFWTWLRLG